MHKDIIRVVIFYIWKLKCYCSLPIALPGPTGRPSVFDVSRDGMTIAWHEPDEDGGSAVTGYIIERKEVRAERWVRANKNPVTMTRYRSTDLIEGLEYEHRVTAINARGVGKPSHLSPRAVATDPVGECCHIYQTQNWMSSKL